MRTIVVLLCLSGSAFSQTAPKPIKTYDLNFDNVEWSKVFEWFSKESGLTYLGVHNLDGKVTLKAEKKTLGEVLDLLNEVLEPKGYIIIRRTQSFVLHPADEKLPRKEWVSLIDLSELKERGDHEFVQLIIPLTTVVADDIVPLWKPLLSKFGEIAPFGSNQIIVMDKAKNVRDIIKYMEASEKRDREYGDQFTHTCKVGAPETNFSQTKRTPPFKRAYVSK